MEHRGRLGLIKFDLDSPKSSDSINEVSDMIKPLTISMFPKLPFIAKGMSKEEREVKFIRYYLSGNVK